MDESEALDALANLINELAEKPFDLSLHIQHIRLAQSLEGMDEEVNSAMEMLTSFYAAPEDIWKQLIQAKKDSVDLGTANGAGEFLALYERAEDDYLSISILESHLDLLISQHARYAEGEIKPDELGEIFSTGWTRSVIEGTVQKGISHLTQSHLLWDKQRDWELERLDNAPASEKAAQVDLVQHLFLARLGQPHSNSEETFQAYSSFTTNYKPPDQYEALLVAASKIRSRVAKAFDRRERKETDLAQSKYSLDAYAHYISYERQAKYPDLSVTSVTYERAIAEAAKRRFQGEAGVEEALRAFWIGYCDALRILNAGEDVELSVLKRAVRSVPGSGEVWARYIRYLERFSDSEQDNKESIADVYSRAFGTNLLQSSVEDIISVVLSRAGYERRRIEAGDADEDTFATLIGILEAGLDMVRKVSPTGDARLRLEKFLAHIYQSAELGDSVLGVWQSAVKHYKSSYLAWISYTEALVKSDHETKARAVFKDVYIKNLDWPEAIWDAWSSFEHLHGSVEEVDACLDRIEKAQYQVNLKRAKEAEQAQYQATQVAMENQASNVPVVAVPVPDVGSNERSMDVDAPAPAIERGTKRSAEEPLPQQSQKKAKTENPVALKRDRENCTVFVADLPNMITDDELKSLFKDCGKIREVKITPLPDSVVATVEFFERESVPQALTKDKKRLQHQEIAVHLAWRSTLYVTNFPESTDDAHIRDLFGKYGTIFDVRWPSKKFKNTRRFCYVQYTLPSSAENALELHGRELESGLKINVFVSNPERKKERTDQDANEREVYVAGLSRYTGRSDLEKIFNVYGPVKEVRMVLDKDGHSKGFAFVEFDDPKHALASLNANNHELKGRRIAVTLSDARVRARNKNAAPETGLGRQAELRSRSVRVKYLPAGTQEGLLQQIMEKITAVKRVEVFEDKREAVIELESASDVGKLLLRTDPIEFGGNILKVQEEVANGGGSKGKAVTGGMFLPRNAASRPRAGLGHAKGAAPVHVAASSSISATQGPTAGKAQDDFRKMLGRK